MKQNVSFTSREGSAHHAKLQQLEGERYMQFTVSYRHSVSYTCTCDQLTQGEERPSIQCLLTRVYMRLNASSGIDLQAERRKHALRAIRPPLQNHRLYICLCICFYRARVTVSGREGRVVNCVSVHNLPVSVKSNICNTFTTRGQNSSRGCTEMFLPSLKRLRTCS